MPPTEEPPSVPSASTKLEDLLLYYKSQYEQLEAELADFQASSRELETELEKDVEASEKREHQLQEKVESLGYEVDEWKTKYKQSKTEANTAQNALQKEITTLRDTNRTIQLKLRDIEVANDDFERQARNTTSSLDDLESKYNVAIERGVMMEEEMKVGELEREGLRIETQRLRDELGDLRVEAEIRSDKLRHAEAAAERQRLRKPTPLDPDLLRPRSPVSEHSPTTTASSPTMATPPTKSASSTVSEAPTPPSPPSSEPSMPVPSGTSAHSVIKSRLSMTTSTATPRPLSHSSRPPRHSRGPSIPISHDRPMSSVARRTTLNRLEHLQNTPGISSSGSLTQIRGLIGKMQKLEERVNSAKSKLPAPTATTPRSSPRSGSALGQSYIPSTVTMRSNKKRTGGSGSSTAFKSPTGNRSTSRLSFGLPQPSPTRDSRSPSRPASSASYSSRTSMSHLSNTTPSNVGRRSSRQSLSRAQTPLGHYASSTYASSTLSESRRPRSSIGGSYASSHPGGGHGYSASVSQLSNHKPHSLGGEPDENSEVLTPTPGRRNTFGKAEINSSGIPALLTSSSAKKKVNDVGERGRRISSGPGYRVREEGDMGPPERKRLSGVGETF